jgi:hypothetical protein
MKQGTQIIAISPADINIQIVPTTNENNPTRISIPLEEQGYIIPLNLFLVDNYNNNEFCGVFEIGTIFFNENIRRDIIDELYRDNVSFDLYVRQRIFESSLGPKIIKEYANCRLYRQELIVPEIGLIAKFRYYFTNSDAPWEISIEKINSMRPPNQYTFDYAVSKAIKNLSYPINDIAKSLIILAQLSKKDEPEETKLTASEYVKLAKEGQA